MLLLIHGERTGMSDSIDNIVGFCMRRNMQIPCRSVTPMVLMIAPGCDVQICIWDRFDQTRGRRSRIILGACSWIGG